MLKAFLDRYGGNGLAGTVAVPVMTGGWAGHRLAVEVHLRPVLVELGATVPSRGLYVTEPEFAGLDAAIAGWAAAAVPLIRAALAGHGREMAHGVPELVGRDLRAACQGVPRGGVCSFGCTAWHLSRRDDKACLPCVTAARIISRINRFLAFLII
jgi:NADPH-dependent FMN reductase